jgi:hypothetical protein
MTDFNLNDVYSRRQALAKRIWAGFGLSPSMSVTVTFDAPPLDPAALAHHLLWHLPFYVIADRIQEETDHCPVIDHAWWLLANRYGSDEPWGFVTEPYLDDFAEAQQIAASVARYCEDWGVEVRALPPAQSAWYPGECTPIAVACPGGVLNGNLIARGVDAFLREIAP